MANYQQKSSIDQKMLERKKLEKITTGEVKVKKASGGSRIAKKIFAEDMNAVKRYIIDDLLIPNIKNFAIDAFSTLLNGKAAPRNPSGTFNYVPYNRSSSTLNQFGKPAGSYSQRADRHDYNQIAFQTRGDAEGVLYAMMERIKQYQRVTIADMYELVGIDCEFTDYKWGWYDLSNAYAVHTRDGYVLSLPRAVALD